MKPKILLFVYHIATIYTNTKGNYSQNMNAKEILSLMKSKNLYTLDKNTRFKYMAERTKLFAKFK